MAMWKCFIIYLVILLILVSDILATMKRNSVTKTIVLYEREKIEIMNTGEPEPVTSEQLYNGNWIDWLEFFCEIPNYFLNYNTENILLYSPYTQILDNIHATKAINFFISSIEPANNILRLVEKYYSPYEPMYQLSFSEKIVKKCNISPDEQCVNVTCNEAKRNHNLTNQGFFSWCNNDGTGKLYGFWDNSYLNCTDEKPLNVDKILFEGEVGKKINVSTSGFLKTTEIGCFRFNLTSKIEPDQSIFLQVTMCIECEMTIQLHCGEKQLDETHIVASDYQYQQNFDENKLSLCKWQNVSITSYKQCQNLQISINTSTRNENSKFWGISKEIYIIKFSKPKPLRYWNNYNEALFQKYQDFQVNIRKRLGTNLDDVLFCEEDAIHKNGTYSCLKPKIQGTLNIKTTQFDNNTIIADWCQDHKENVPYEYLIEIREQNSGSNSVVMRKRIIANYIGFGIGANCLNEPIFNLHEDIIYKLIISSNVAQNSTFFFLNKFET